MTALEVIRRESHVMPCGLLTYTYMACGCLHAYVATMPHMEPRYPVLEQCEAHGGAK